MAKTEARVWTLNGGTGNIVVEIDGANYEFTSGSAEPVSIGTDSVDLLVVPFGRWLEGSLDVLLSIPQIDGRVYIGSSEGVVDAEDLLTLKDQVFGPVDATEIGSISGSVGEMSFIAAAEIELSNDFALHITGEASLDDLGVMDDLTDGDLSYETIRDTAENLVDNAGGYIAGNITVIVDGPASIAQLDDILAIDLFNGVLEWHTIEDSYANIIGSEYSASAQTLIIVGPVSVDEIETLIETFPTIDFQLDAIHDSAEAILGLIALVGSEDFPNYVDITVTGSATLEQLALIAAELDEGELSYTSITGDAETLAADGGEFIKGSVAVTITDSEESQLAATLLSTIGGLTNGLVTVENTITISGNSAELLAALHTADTLVVADDANVLVDGAISVANANNLNLKTSGSIDGVISEQTVAALLGLTSEGEHHYYITVADDSASAANLLAIEGKTVETVNALGVDTISGSASDFLDLFEAVDDDEIELAEDFAANVSGKISHSNANLIDGSNGDGIVTAEILETDIDTLLELNPRDNAYTISVEGASVAAAALDELKAATILTINATGVDKLTGTAAVLAGVISSTDDFEFAEDVAVEFDGEASVEHLNIIAANTTATLTATVEDTLITSLLDLDEVHAYTITVAGASVDAGDLLTLTGKTTGSIDVSGVTKLTGTASEIEEALDASLIVGDEQIDVQILDDESVAAGLLTTIKNLTDGDIDATAVTEVFGDAEALDAVLDASDQVELNASVSLRLTGTATLDEIEALAGHTLDFDLETLVLADMDDISTYNGGAALAETLDIDADASISVTMSAAQYSGFTGGILAAGDNDTITLTTVGEITTDADVRHYTVFAGSTVILGGAYTNQVIQEGGSESGDTTVYLPAGTYTADWLGFDEDDIIKLAGDTNLSGNEGLDDGITLDFQQLDLQVTLTAAQADNMQVAGADGINLQRVTVTTATGFHTVEGIETYTLAAGSQTVTIEANLNSLTATSIANDQTLTLLGTGNVASISLLSGDLDASLAEGDLTVTAIGQVVSSLVTGSGDDSFVIHNNSNDPLGRTFNGGGGTDRLRISSTSAQDFDLRDDFIVDVETLDLSLGQNGLDDPSNVSQTVTLTAAQYIAFDDINADDTDVLKITGLSGEEIAGSNAMDHFIFAASDVNVALMNFDTVDDRINVYALASGGSATVISGTPELTTTAGTVYFFVGSPDDAQSATNSAAALNAAANWTAGASDVTAYFIITGALNTAIYKWVDEANTNGVLVGELTLIGTIDGAITTGNLLFS